MRRIALIAATALTALACALLPSGALAHGHHHGHHYARRARHHGRRSNRGLHRGLYGASAGNGSQQPASSGSQGAQGTETVGPTSDTQQGNAGKIVSFTEGVLTIQLGEGEKATTISGKVTEETEIHCIPAPTATSTSTPSTTSPPSTTGPSGSDDGWSGWGQGQQSQQGEPGWGHDDQGAGDDDEGDRNQEGGEHCQQCGPADLTPGTVVHRAELLLTESGAVFREIELVH